MYDYYYIKSLRGGFIGIEAPAIIKQYTWLLEYIDMLTLKYDFVCSVVCTVVCSFVFGVFVHQFAYGM